MSAVRDIRHANCFDAMRLAAALMVLYSHGYALSGRLEPGFAGLNSLGGIGVAVFFAMSGFLITQSWLSDPHAGRFFIRRALRIFPGLAVVVLLSVFILGPVETTLGWHEYFANHFTWLYLRNIVLLADYYLPGVFEHLPAPNAVNGSLWSLPAEFLMYIVVGLLGVARLLRRRWIVAGFALTTGAAQLILHDHFPQPILFLGMELHQVLNVAPYFWAGAVLYLFQDVLHFRLTWVVVVYFALIMLPTGDTLTAWSWFAVPYIVLAFCLQGDEWFRIPRRVGDLSYGIYIYAFPVQQMLFQALGTTVSVYAYITFAALVTAAFAFASWHLVEHPCLRLKPRRREPASAPRDGTAKPAF